MKSNSVSTIWAGWFNSIPTAIAALNTAFSLTTVPTTAPLRYPIVDDKNLVSQPWGLGFFVFTQNAINALFAAASLTDKLPPPPLQTPMQWNEFALRLPWIGWFTAVANALLQLQDAAAAPNMAALGDSLTVGFPVDPAGAYPTQLGAFLGLTIANLGINGEQSAGVLATEVPTAIGLFVPGVTNIALVEIGRNDLAGGPGNLGTLQANVIAIVAALQGAGYSVIVLTMTPSNFAGQPASFPADRDTYNAWLLAGSSGANAVCNSGEDPLLANTADLTYYQADQLHMTTPGYGVVANDALPIVRGFIVTANFQQPPNGAVLLNQI